MTNFQIGAAGAATTTTTTTEPSEGPASAKHTPQNEPSSVCAPDDASRENKLERAKSSRTSDAQLGVAGQDAMARARFESLLTTTARTRLAVTGRAFDYAVESCLPNITLNEDNG